MKENFIKKSDVHSYCTRKSKCNFYVPVITSATASTFYYNGVLTWNAESIQCINSHFKLKKEVYCKNVKSYGRTSILELIL